MTALALALTLCLATTASAQTVPAPQPPIFAGHVESVVIDAFVSGRPPNAPRLEVRDFVLKDDGVSQSFDLIPAEELPIRAVLVFDTSGSMKGAKLDRLRAAAESFVEKLGPQDEVALVSFSEEVAWLAPLSREKTSTRVSLLRLRAAGGTSAHDALFAALLIPGSSFRTLVVLFTDGEDNSSWLDEKQLRKFVQRSNSLIHVVSARSDEAATGFGPRYRAPGSSHVKTMRELAEVTGGALVEVDSPARIEAAFTGIIEAMRGRYVLRYDPENPRPGWHRLELQLRSGAGKVRGRTGYWMETR
ncbi:MAG: VWA domain-containing protein [Vicinamibacteria bacterium]|nr:VWA domain-containing protein [Vicinamibacteria bacterium]